MINFEEININKIADFIKQGEKSCENKSIGIECEHFIVNKRSEAVSFYGDSGIEKILEKLSAFYPKASYSDNRLVGLNDGVLFITLEPASQIEVSIIPLSSLAKVKDIYINFINNISPILNEYGYRLVNSGYQPKSKVDELKLIPKERYRMMDYYFLTLGNKARYMMRGSASVQVNIDYENQDDFNKKFKLANILSPLFYLLTDNSNIFEGEEYNKFSLRSYIWENVDNNRCGFLDFESYLEYAHWIYNSQPIFINQNNEDIYCDSLTNKDIFNSKEINQDDIKHIISMVFPNVRVKQFIEIRPADSMSIDLMLSYGALIKGIFYNSNAVENLLDIFKNTSIEDLISQMHLIQNNGFNCEYLGYDMKYIISTLYSLAEIGLDLDEKFLLKPLAELNLNFKSPKFNTSTEVAVL